MCYLFSKKKYPTVSVKYKLTNIAKYCCPLQKNIWNHTVHREKDSLAKILNIVRQCNYVRITKLNLLGLLHQPVAFSYKTKTSTWV